MYANLAARSCRSVLRRGAYNRRSCVSYIQGVPEVATL